MRHDPGRRLPPHLPPVEHLEAVNVTLDPAVGSLRRTRRPLRARPSRRAGGARPLLDSGRKATGGERSPRGDARISGTRLRMP